MRIQMLFVAVIVALFVALTTLTVRAATEDDGTGAGRPADVSVTDVCDEVSDVAPELCSDGGFCHTYPELCRRLADLCREHPDACRALAEFCKTYPAGCRAFLQLCVQNPERCLNIVHFCRTHQAFCERLIEFCETHDVRCRTLLTVLSHCSHHPERCRHLVQCIVHPDRCHDRARPVHERPTDSRPDARPGPVVAPAG